MVKKHFVITGLFLLLIAISYAASEVVQTTINLNVPSILAFTVTLPGQSANESGTAGSPGTTASIEFNASAGTDTDVQPCVVGGSCQNNATSTAIFQYDNTGTVDLSTVTIVLSSNPPSCITINGNTTTGVCWSGSVVNATAITVTSSFTPAASAVDYYLCADFSSCVSSDSTTRTLNHTGTE